MTFPIGRQAGSLQHSSQCSRNSAKSRDLYNQTVETLSLCGLDRALWLVFPTKSRNHPVDLNVERRTRTEDVRSLITPQATDHHVLW